MHIEHLYILENSTNFQDWITTCTPSPDIILLDIHVKPINGFEMLKVLRADPAYQEARVIALTASVMNEEIEELQKSGFDGTIAKPISVLTFPGLIEQVIQGESVWHIA